MQRLFDDVVEYVNLLGSGWRRRRRNRYPDHCYPDLTVSNGFVECIPSCYALLVRCLHRHHQIRRMMVSSSRQYYRHQKKQHRAASYQSRQIDYNMFPTDTIFFAVLGSTHHHYYHWRRRRIFHQRQQHRYVEWSRQCLHLDWEGVRYYWSQ
jgi:hypothetical protein